ncbi:hypothetical protein Nepgr_027597 [Nepenthes gracilis]|uniref:CP12 domain-containing protein n=1 Tax=Nepenthes gracilis TaxID=150966 RepID=A0AAD3Y396_NEPGR|nr:hypothetical protein Nepgr_027597 [Nepenthes gracilis]
MATISGASLLLGNAAASAGCDTPRAQTIRWPILSRHHPWKRSSRCGAGGRMTVKPVAAAPDKLSEKVAESVKQAEEVCAGDPKSGECVAAWDEVEELSAAASHARDKKKVSDPLEAYCKDHPETEECRTYED